MESGKRSQQQMVNPFSVERQREDDRGEVRISNDSDQHFAFVSPPSFFERVATKILGIRSLV